jgi:transcription elongation factor SPT6
MDLINENIGRDNRKRLRKKADEDRDEVAQLFDDDDLEAEAAPQVYREKEAYDDDLDDFIIRDDSDEGELDDDDDERRQERIQRRKERHEFAKNLGADHGISDTAWADVEDLFNADEYDYALTIHQNQPLILTVDEEEVRDDGDLPVLAKTKELKLKDVYEPSEIAEKMLTEEDEVIRIRDIPERYQVLFLSNSRKLKIMFQMMLNWQEKPLLLPKRSFAKEKSLKRFFKMPSFQFSVSFEEISLKSLLLWPIVGTILMEY